LLVLIGQKSKSGAAAPHGSAQAEETQQEADDDDQADDIDDGVHEIASGKGLGGYSPQYACLPGRTVRPRALAPCVRSRTERTPVPGYRHEADAVIWRVTPATTRR